MMNKEEKNELIDALDKIKKVKEIKNASKIMDKDGLIEQKNRQYFVVKNGEKKTLLNG
jgi:hypothetical protein